LCEPSVDNSARSGNGDLIRAAGVVGGGDLLLEDLKGGSEVVGQPDSGVPVPPHVWQERGLGKIEAREPDGDDLARWGE
jgi:hypothetical protein